MGPGPQVANVLIYQQGRIGTRNLCALEKSINEYDTFKYYVVGLKMAEVDYTVKLAIGVKNGYTYYDHALTPISIQKLLKSIDEIKRPFAFKESSANGEQVSDVLSECKDKRLISILQIK